MKNFLCLLLLLLAGCAFHEQDGKFGPGKSPKRWHDEPLDPAWYYDPYGQEWRKN